MADLNALVIFAKVAEAKSFSAAARLLKVPASTVSRRVAELEDELGVRLLQRSTRSLRLTDAGAEVYDHARRGADVAAAVDAVAADHRSGVSGVLRLSAPLSLSDGLLSPILLAFGADHPDVRVQLLVTERFVDPVAEGFDLVFRVGPLADSSMVARTLLTYRHQLVASPAYLARCRPPTSPADLPAHRLLAFAHWRPRNRWSFRPATGGTEHTVTFAPHLAMNDYAGLAAALAAGGGIAYLPPLVRPDLLRDGRLIEVLPGWHLRTAELSLVHPAHRHVRRPVRLFKDLAARMAPTLFPALPT